MAVDSTLDPRGVEALRIARRAEPARRGRRSPTALGGAAVAVAMVAIAARAVYERTAGRPPAVRAVMVAAAPAATPGVVLVGSGYIVTRRKYITVGTKVLGQIVEEPIEEGQRVKKGDLLARIDDRDYRAQWRQAAAARDLAEANHRLYDEKAARARELFQAGVISTDDFATAVTTAQVARAQRQRDEAAVDYAKFMVDQCLITAPIDGIVLRKYRELGDTINYGGQVQAGGGSTDIAQIADTGDMRAEVDLNEADIAKVAVGSPAVVEPDAYAGRRFDASLVKIYPEADRQKGTVKIEVRIPNPDLRVVRPEMSVKVNFLESRPAQVEGPRFTVPESAVKTVGDASFVWTVRDGVARQTAIVRGREMEGGIEVTRGLHEGDLVVIAPDVGLQDGDKVRLERP